MTRRTEAESVDELGRRVRERNRRAVTEDMTHLGADLWIWNKLQWQGFSGGYIIDGEVVLEDGQYVVDTFTVRRMKGAAPITSETLRLLPVSQLFRDSMRSTFDSVMEGAGFRPGEDPPSTVAQMVQAGTETGLEYVAAVYRLAHAFGYSPTVGLGQAFRASRATAGRWIAQAREKGILGPATGTKAGEQRKENRRGTP